VTVCVGVDGCKGGWIAVWRDDRSEPKTEVFETFYAVFQSAPDDSVIVVDIPIGLPDRIVGKGRAAEQKVRELLKGKTSSVFSVPSREAVEQGALYLEDYRSKKISYEESYARTKEVACSTSNPAKALSRQAFGILPKIAEVDELLRGSRSLAARVWESHPEAAFCMMDGKTPVASRKSSAEGAAARREVLQRRGLPAAFLGEPPPSGAKTDDFLDACAMLLVAEAICANRCVSHPSPPDRDRYNLPIAIWTSA
jgi:predicted RNase H-like nuclease